jgi:hypothetical protein
VYASVLRGVLVAVFAVGAVLPIGIATNGGAELVFGVCDRFEMIGIDTVPNSAEVIDLEPFGHRSD